MITPSLRLLGGLLFLTLAVFARGMEAAPLSPSAALRAGVLAEVTAADDERVAATMAGDRQRLAAILSDQLHYGHSNGVVDDKQTFIEKLAGKRSVYEKMDYARRSFLPAGDDVVLMPGRILLRVRNGEQIVNLDLSYLAVWRKEQGVWRFLAWQSCPNPPAK